MYKFLAQVAGASFGLYIASQLIRGFTINGNLVEYLFAGAVFTLLNILLKPIMKIVFAPLILLSLGSFLIVINAAILIITDFIFNFIIIKGFWSLVLATIIISILNFLVETMVIEKS